jgi:hypothetical protein
MKAVRGERWGAGELGELGEVGEVGAWGCVQVSAGEAHADGAEQSQPQVDAHEGGPAQAEGGVEVRVAHHLRQHAPFFSSGGRAGSD